MSSRWWALKRESYENRSVQVSNPVHKTLYRQAPSKSHVCRVNSHNLSPNLCVYESHGALYTVTACDGIRCFYFLHVGTQRRSSTTSPANADRPRNATCLSDLCLPHLHPPPLRGPCRNIDMTFGTEKLEWCGYLTVKTF